MIPTELREEEEKLSHEIELDTFAHEHKDELPTIDDEYAEMGHRDPKVRLVPQVIYEFAWRLMDGETVGAGLRDDEPRSLRPVKAVLERNQGTQR